MVSFKQVHVAPFHQVMEKNAKDYLEDVNLLRLETKNITLFFVGLIYQVFRMFCSKQKLMRNADPTKWKNYWIDLYHCLLTSLVLRKPYQNLETAWLCLQRTLLIYLHLTLSWILTWVSTGSKEPCLDVHGGCLLAA